MRLLPNRLFIPFLALLALSACTSTRNAATDAPRAEAAIRAVLDAQVAAWNRGDVAAFMDGYWRSDALRFASGGTIARGWQTTLDRYRRSYPDRAAMGTLTFSDLDIDVFAPDAAVVFGRWALARDAAHPPASGLFTLTFRRFDEGWRIVADHTSSG
jgi:ketosteroid isomerase-like protein